MAQIKECRICLGQNVAVDDEWLSPCHCDGSMKWVHRKCLDHWRQLATTWKGKHQCSICKYIYRVEAGWANPVRWLMFRLVESNCRRRDLFYIYVPIITFTGVMIHIADPSFELRNVMARVFYGAAMVTSLTFGTALTILDWLDEN